MAESKSRLKCPFCHGGITEQLALYGGPCPHCMLEIPGEEAPTDPGIARKQAAAAAAKLEEERARKTRTIAGAGVASLLVAALVAGVFLLKDSSGRLYIEHYRVDPEAQKPSQAAKSADQAGDAAGSNKPARIAARGQVAGGAAPEAPSGGGLAALAARASAGGAGAQGATTLNFGTVAQGAPPTPQPLLGGPSGSTPTFSGGTVAGASLTGGAVAATAGSSPTIASGGGQTVQTEADARASIGRGVEGYIRQMTSCVQLRQSTDPSFGGNWTLRFNVQPDGTTRDHGLDGRSDGEFQACALGKMRGWKFQPTGRTVPWSSRHHFGM